MQEAVEQQALALYEKAQGQPRDLSVELWVIDTNVVMDFIHFNDVNTAPIFQAIQEHRIQVLAHRAAFVELYDVLSRPIFKADPQSIEPTLAAWLEHCVLESSPLESTSYCKDSDDDKFFELAKVAGAQVLLSKDKLVFKARHRARRFGCDVLKPVDALKRLAQKG